MSLVNVSKSDGIATVKINRPDKYNAMNTEVAKELTTVFNEIDKDDAIKAASAIGEELRLKENELTSVRSQIHELALL